MIGKTKEKINQDWSRQFTCLNSDVANNNKNAAIFLASDTPMIQAREMLFADCRLDTLIEWRFDVSACDH